LRLAALFFLAAASPALASKPFGDCPSRHPLDPWSRKTEPGVTVRCGPSKIQKVPGQCAMLTVEPEGGKAWTAWANEDPPSSVRTFNRGELLVVGDPTLRLYTRETRDRDKRVGRQPPGARLLSGLTMDARDKLPNPTCADAPIIRDMRLDGTEHLIVSIVQQTPERKRAPSVELRVNIADGTMSQLDFGESVRDLPAGVLTEPVFPSTGPRFEKCGTPSGRPAPTPSAPSVATALAPAPAVPSPVDLDRPLPEAKDPVRMAEAPKPEGPPSDRPTAQATFGARPMRGYKPRSDDSLCASAPAVPLVLLAALALRRRRAAAR
jgi:hypothetical protein